MPDPTKSSRKKLSANTKPKMTALTAKGTETNRADKDGRMAGARQDALDKDVKKAGGSKAYLDKVKKTKENLVKYKGTYYRKDSATGKAILAKKK
jgi:hypothetical protein